MVLKKGKCKLKTNNKKMNNHKRKRINKYEFSKLDERASNYKKKIRELQTALAKIIEHTSISSKLASEITGFTSDQLKYWKKMSKEDPQGTRTFQGGQRNWLFGSKEHESLIETELKLWKSNPLKTCTWFAETLDTLLRYDIESLEEPFSTKKITESFIRDIFTTFMLKTIQLLLIMQKYTMLKNLKHY